VLCNLFDKNFAYVRRVRPVASARLPSSAHAAELIVPCSGLDGSRKPNRCPNKWGSSYPWFSGVLVQSFLQLFFRLVIELLVAALRLTGLLPELICAADNINFSGLAHWRLSLRSGCDDFRRSLTRRDVRPKWFVAPTGAR